MLHEYGCVKLKFLKCPICKKSFSVYIHSEDGFRIADGQEFDEISVYCIDCGFIGTVDIKIHVDIDSFKSK